MAIYQKMDSELGYVDDVADIEYLKFQNVRHTILGNMLGDFDEEGEYVVDPDIVKELLTMKKYVVETIDNMEIVLSEVKLDKQINFLITYEGERATLSLIEKLSFDANYKTDSGIYSNINEYLLDEVTTSGMVDRSILYRRWNISMSGSNVLDIFSMDEETIASLYKIAARFKSTLLSNKVLMEKEEELEEIEAAFYVDTMAVLARFPKLKKAVEADIGEALKNNSAFIKIDKPYFAKTLNEILTNAIEENIGVLNEEEKLDFHASMRKAKVDYNNKIRGELDVVEERQATSELGDKPKVVKLGTANLPEKSLAETAKDFVNAERATTERLRRDATIVLTGKDPQPEKGKKSALAGAILGAAGVAAAAATGGVAGALIGAATASSRAGMFAAIGGAIGALVGKQTQEKIDELKPKVDETKKGAEATKSNENAASTTPKKPEVKKAPPPAKKKEGEEKKKPTPQKKAASASKPAAETSLGSGGYSSDSPFIRKRVNGNGRTQNYGRSSVVGEPSARTETPAPKPASKLKKTRPFAEVSMSSLAELNKNENNVSASLEERSTDINILLGKNTGITPDGRNTGVVLEPDEELTNEHGSTM